ncbi:Hypothetical protein KVN_LOCUS272 [uncultured virus]|nr:Hypothetical protein KVN_LOCUS272 [uncultured virus]
MNFLQKYTDQYKTNISDDFVNEFKNLQKKIEKSNNTKYEISIKEVGKNALVITSFSERNSKYQIKDMKLGFEELNGEYESYNAIILKLEQLLISEITDEIKIVDNEKIWKCKHCGKFGRDNNLPNNYLFNNLCQNCTHSYTSKWKYINIYPESNLIGQCFGGSISSITRMGTLLFD